MSPSAQSQKGKIPIVIVLISDFLPVSWLWFHDIAHIQRYKHLRC